MTVVLVTLIVAAALILGAVWGLYGKLSEGLEGFLIAMAGGALIVSVVAELIDPASEEAPLWIVMGAVAVGAVSFTLIDQWIETRFGEDSGGGLLAAITLDGVPENLALGVALIGAGFAEVAALAGSIFLSNLPEAAGGAKSMRNSGIKRGKALGLWCATAGLLCLATFAGYGLLSNVSPVTLAIVRSFAAGAVVASLAIEVFPKAFREDDRKVGFAVALGLIIAYTLHAVG